MELRKTVVLYGFQSGQAQSFHLAIVVDDVAQTIEALFSLKFCFSLFDSSGHTMAETGTTINFDIHMGRFIKERHV